MNILICDDILYEAESLERLLLNTGFEVNTVVFTDGQEALAYFSSGEPVDVCFLDILMPAMDGIKLAEALREIGFIGFIIFLTGSKEYAPESYMVKAFDYLIKPASPERVKEVLTELIKAQETADLGGILVKGTGISRRILFREISHIEIIHNVVHIRLTDGSVHKTRSTLSEITLQLLEDTRFIQSHRSFIVNMDDIIALKGNEFLLRNGTSIPISRNHISAKDRYISATKKSNKSTTPQNDNSKSAAEDV